MLDDWIDSEGTCPECGSPIQTSPWWDDSPEMGGSCIGTSIDALNASGLTMHDSNRKVDRSNQQLRIDRIKTELFCAIIDLINETSGKEAAGKAADVLRFS